MAKEISNLFTCHTIHLFNIIIIYTLNIRRFGSPVVEARSKIARSKILAQSIFLRRQHAKQV
jgi:hypothetical protein